MARYEYTAGVGANLLNDVQSIVITKGRRLITDPFKASTAVISGRDIDNLPSVNIGDVVGVSVQGTTDWPFPTDIFNGVVADVKLNYGITSDLDTWEIYAEDTLALAGRAFTANNKSLTAGDTTLEAAQDVASDLGISVNEVFVGNTSQSTVSATSVANDNLLNILNTLVATEQGRIWGSGTANTIAWVGRNWFTNATAEGTFTDGTLTASTTFTSKFDSIAFFSAGDNYATRVITEPAGLTSQTSGTGDRVFTLKTYDQTTTQAKNLADYVLASLDVSSGVPYQLSVLAETTTNRFALTAAADGGKGYLLKIILRGVEYDCFVEGVTISATPESSRFTFNLSSSVSKVGFILDSAIFGVLDTNKLGF